MTPQHSKTLLTRFFLGLAFASLLLSLSAWAQHLNPSSIPKFVDPLPRVCGVIPTPNCLVMPATTRSNTLDTYEVAERQFQQQILPSAFNTTTVWGFGPASEPASLAGQPGSLFHTPAATMETTFQRTVQVKWINDLRDSSGNFLTYPAGVTIDAGGHWANPPQRCADGRTATDCTGRGGVYSGPVPTTVHLHGISAESESDGIPESWVLPAANNIPAGFATHGSDYCQVNTAGARACAYNNDGAQLFQYPNGQYPSTLFFHDHTLGVTLQNVYMGLVGFYVLSGGGPVYDVPSDCGTCGSSLSVPGGLPGGDYEIPLAIQDKSFNVDGSLRGAEEGDVKVVNGKSWPYLQVEPRKYRFRFVNGQAAAYLGLIFSTGRLKFQQIGADGGFLPQPAVLSKLSFAPGERLDVVVDFSGLKSCAGAACNVTLLDDNASGATRQVMQFRVGNAVTGGTDTSSVPATLPHQAPLAPETNVRKVALVGELLGIFQSGTPVAMLWDDPTTENITLGPGNTPVVERWDMYNYSPDSHPMHLHEVQFQVVNRENIATGVVFNCTGTAVNAAGNTVNCASPPLPGEAGFKDTVASNVGEITRVRVQFGPNNLDTSPRVGLFAWHCHIIPHEDGEMMRPMCIVSPNSTPVPGDGIVGNTNPSCPSIR
jgi:spore coat protein A